MIRRYIAMISFSLFSLQSLGTHIIGGEIYYDCLGGNIYYITLKVYLDCCPTCTTHDDEAGIGVYDSQGNPLSAHKFPLQEIRKVPPTLYAKCFIIPSEFCVNEVVYGGTLFLPPIPGGYTVAYQRCCRNSDILNIINARAAGSTYQTFIDPMNISCNNSARYKDLPPLLLCVDAPFVFDNSASDPDNDSIVYEFCSPFAGADDQNPMPTIPSNPPFEFVEYNPPYSGSYPISASTNFKIDPHTGIITGTPDMMGRFVVGVCAKEYRHGILLNTNKRDYQFNVVQCPISAKAEIPNQTIFCTGLTMNFSQNSIGANTFHWSFGDPTTTSDTSNLASPRWTYPDEGTYDIMLVINRFTKCADTAYGTVKIQNLLKPFFTTPPAKCMGEVNEGFTATGNYAPGTQFLWDFGPSATPTHVNKQDPGKIIYKNYGSFPVTLTVTYNGCVKIYKDYMTVLQKPEANYTIENNVSCFLRPVHFINESTGVLPMEYLWSFGDESGTNDYSPFHTYKKIGDYYTSLIISSANGCMDTFKLPTVIAVQPVPKAGFDVDPKDTSVFYSTIHLTDYSKNTSVCKMFWGDGSSEADCISSHTYTQPGIYQIMQIADNNGCFDTAYAEVVVRPDFVFWVPNAFTPGESEGLNDIYKPTIVGAHDYRFQIFDRWGLQLFQTSNLEEGWNGRIQSNLCQADVYIYKIDFVDDVKMKQHHYIGHFTLVR